MTLNLSFCESKHVTPLSVEILKQLNFHEVLLDPSSFRSVASWCEQLLNCLGWDGMSSLDFITVTSVVIALLLTEGIVFHVSKRKKICLYGKSVTDLCLLGLCLVSNKIIWQHIIPLLPPGAATNTTQVLSETDFLSQCCCGVQYHSEQQWHAKWNHSFP